MERFLHRLNRCHCLVPALGLIAWCFTGVCEAETIDLPTRFEVTQDTHIGLKGGQNKWLDSYLYISEKVGRDTYYEKSLIQFDLSGALPFVKSASMYVFCGNEHSPVDLHVMKVDWIDSQATGLNRKTGIAWASPYLRSSTDVDYHGIPIVDNFDPVYRSWNVIDITETFDSWVTGAVPNNGLLITYTSLLNNTEFASKEYADKKPYILVQYYDTYEVRLGDYPQNNTAWMISADYLRGEVHGDVSSATINDPSPFVVNRLEWMLGDLAGRTVANASAIVVLEASATIAFATDADQETRLNKAVITNPANSERNKIVSQGAGVRPLVIQAHANQTADLITVSDATESILARINEQGYLGVGVDPVAPIDSGGSMRVGGMIGDGTDGEFQYDGTTFKGWHDGAWRDFLSAEEILAGTDWVKSITETVTSGLVAFFTDPITIRGATEFSWNNSTKVLNILGGINATTFQGNGVNVTNVNALQLGGHYASAFLQSSTMIAYASDIIASLNLGTAAKRDAEDSVTNGSALPDGAAIIAYASDVLANQGNWDSAYAWGDHSIVGYLTSISEDDLNGIFTQGGFLKRTNAGNYTATWDLYVDHVNSTYGYEIPNVADMSLQGDAFRIESQYDIRLAPTGTAKISAATLVEFDDFLGDKIRFYSHSYSIGVSAFDLDITSDRNIKFHSDTVPDLVQIIGDVGDLIVKHNVESGGVYKFSADTTGDKLLLYSTLYRLAVSSNTLDSYSDWYFKWHSDSNQDAMVLDANTGNLTIEGTFTGNGSGLTNLSVPWTSLTGNPSSVITLQAPLYWVNGNTIGIQDYYVKKSGDTMSGQLNMGGNTIYHPKIILNPSRSATGMSVGELRLYVP